MKTFLYDFSQFQKLACRIRPVLPWEEVPWLISVSETADCQLKKSRWFRRAISWNFWCRSCSFYIPDLQWFRLFTIGQGYALSHRIDLGKKHAGLKFCPSLTLAQPLPGALPFIRLFTAMEKLSCWKVLEKRNLLSSSILSCIRGLMIPYRSAVFLGKLAWCYQWQTFVGCSIVVQFFKLLPSFLGVPCETDGLNVLAPFFPLSYLEPMWLSSFSRKSMVIAEGIRVKNHAKFIIPLCVTARTRDLILATAAGNHIWLLFSSGQILRP